MRYEEVIIAGFGGQGIMFSGSLLAQASMEEGLKVTFFPSYGAEMRGGTANCTVLISEEEIGSPVSRHPMSALILNQASFSKYFSWLRKDGLLVLNSSLVKEYREGEWKLLKIPATEIADKAGFGKGANLVILGAYIRETEIVSFKAMNEALKKLFKGREELIGINQKLLKEGFQYK